MTGTIISIDPRGFGFVKGDDSVCRLFQAKEVRGTTFDRLALGTRVSFTPGGLRFGKGPRALAVQPLADSMEVAA